MQRTTTSTCPAASAEQPNSELRAAKLVCTKQRDSQQRGIERQLLAEDDSPNTERDRDMAGVRARQLRPIQ